MALFETEAIVLKTLRLGEADKLVTFLTHRRGKIKGVAQGARRLRSRFGAALEPFTHCHVIFFEKKPTILLRINQADILHPFLKIRGDLERIGAASRMIQLIMALLPEGEAHTKMFSLLLSGLSQVEKSRHLEWLVRVFEIRCLRYAGYQTRWDRCLNCHREIGSRPVFFSPRNGGAVCDACVQTSRDDLPSISPRTLSMMRLMTRMKWSGLSRIKVTSDMLKELQNMLDAHLTFILGKPLQPMAMPGPQYPPRLYID